MRFLVLLFGLAGLLVLAVWGSLAMWRSMGDVAMPAAGMASLVGGVLATFVVGVGLMALVFYSSRRGHDQAAADGASRIDQVGGPALGKTGRGG